MFLKIYIRAFQLASDLDDTVEDKLLIGDRPKPSYDPETKLPLKERLAAQKQDEIDEVGGPRRHRALLPDYVISSSPQRKHSSTTMPPPYLRG